MLLTARPTPKAAARCAYWVGAAARPRPSATPTGRCARRPTNWSALLTPIVKAFLTDNGFVATNLAHAGVRRPRLHPRVGHGAVRARHPHQHDLRRHQHHPVARPAGPQARPAPWPAVPALLPSHGRIPAEASSGRLPIGGAAGQGVRPAAAGHRSWSPGRAWPTQRQRQPPPATICSCSAMPPVFRRTEARRHGGGNEPKLLPDRSEDGAAAPVKSTGDSRSRRPQAPGARP